MLFRGRAWRPHGTRGRVPLSSSPRAQPNLKKQKQKHHRHRQQHQRRPLRGPCPGGTGTKGAQVEEWELKRRRKRRTRPRREEGGAAVCHSPRVSLRCLSPRRRRERRQVAGAVHGPQSRQSPQLLALLRPATEARPGATPECPRRSGGEANRPPPQRPPHRARSGRQRRGSRRATISWGGC